MITNLIKVENVMLYNWLYNEEEESIQTHYQADFKLSSIQSYEGVISYSGVNARWSITMVPTGNRCIIHKNLALVNQCLSSLMQTKEFTEKNELVQGLIEQHSQMIPYDELSITSYDNHTFSKGVLRVRFRLNEQIGEALVYEDSKGEVQSCSVEIRKKPYLGFSNHLTLDIINKVRLYFIMQK